MANSSSSSSSKDSHASPSSAEKKSASQSVGDVNIMTPPTSKPALEVGGPSSSAIPPPAADKPGLGMGVLDLLPLEGSAAAAATAPTQAQPGAGGGSTAVVTVPGRGSTAPAAVPGSGEGAATSGARRKRGRPSEGGVQVPLVIGGDRRGKGELDAPRNAEPACSLCGKKFVSWKAYFGHLRAHPDREWRGAFPPPKGGDNAAAAAADSRKLLEQELAPTLLEIAEQTLTKIRAGGDQETAGGSTRGLAINIDLNRNPYDEAGPSTAAGPKGFDLNMLPPPDDEEDEDEEADEGNAPGDDKGKGKMI